MRLFVAATDYASEQAVLNFNRAFDMQELLSSEVSGYNRFVTITLTK